MSTKILRLELTEAQARALIDVAMEGVGGLKSVFADPHEAPHYSQADKDAAAVKHTDASIAIAVLRSVVRWEF